MMRRGTIDMERELQIAKFEMQTGNFSDQTHSRLARKLYV